MKPPPLSLYIHIPWCIRKCPYCDFNSHSIDSGMDESEYVKALLVDIVHEAEKVVNREVNTIFIGGGTPSLFSPESIDKIITAVNNEFSCVKNIEITMEANPGTFEQEKFSEFIDTGINRLSIGIQSFDNNLLEKIGRVHNGSESHNAIDIAQKVGFENINLDLMFGLPQQTTSSSITDIEHACAHQPAHISHYQLTIEPNTYFHKHKPNLPDDENIWEMFQSCHAILNNNNYRQYEVSAFSKSNMECAHNMNYWMFGDYVGIGAGAHGKLTNAKTGEITRYWKRKQPRDYINHSLCDSAIAGEQRLSKKDLMLEFLMNAMRLKNGFPVNVFESRTGINKQELYELMEQQDQQLIEYRDDTIRASDRGYLYLDELLSNII